MRPSRAYCLLPHNVHRGDAVQRGADLVENPAQLARVGFELGPCLDQRMSCPTLDVQRGLRRKTARRFFDQHSSVASVQTGRSAPKLTIDIRSAAMPFEIR